MLVTRAAPSQQEGISFQLVSTYPTAVRAPVQAAPPIVDELQQYGATPIILANKSHKRRAAKEAKFQATPEFKALYRQRQSVERAFSRLKGQRSLNSITTRARLKVTAHCYLGLIAMQAQARG